MTDKRINAAECGYAEKLVEYVYDEAGAAERTAFEKHLRDCAGCADEVAAFSGISFSIQDWKSARFDLLQTPSISIPYESKQPEAEVAGTNGSWLSAIRGLFTLSPSWSLATASLAVIAVTVGLVIFSMRSVPVGDLAEGNKNSKKAASQTPPANTAPVVVPAEKKKDTIAPSDQPEVTVEKSTNNSTTRVVKAVNNQRAPTAKPDQTKPKDTKRLPRQNDEADSTTDGEEEDDSLRLAELFDEIGTD